jgi:hypothetical protein
MGYGPHGNTVSNSSSVVAFVFIAAGTCISSCCIATVLGEDIDAQKARRSHKPSFIFQNNESRLKRKCTKYELKKNQYFGSILLSDL